MQLHLIAHSGYANETQAPIEGWFGTEGGTVGRDPRCNMVLVDPMRRISRIQAQIIWENNAFHLLNASTSNPIYVNGRELAPGARLAIGAKDEWRTGNYVISVEQATHAASAPSALVTQIPVRREASDAASVLQPVEPHSPSLHVPSDAAGLLPPQPLASPIIEKHQGPASALRGPFDDLLSTPVEQPPAAQAYTAENNAAQAHLPGDPFAMPTAPIQQPAGRSSSPASRSDPFADLMSGPIDAQLSSAPASQIRRGTSSVIPDDFNPMASGGVAHRNIDDPLQNMFQSGNVKEMFPERSFDAIFQPNEGSIDSMTLDPLHTDKHQSFMDASTKVDPLDLFSRERVAGDLNPEVLFGNDKPGGPVQRDHTSEMGSYFRAPRALHEETFANDAVSERPLPSAASSAEELPDPLAPFSPASAPPAHPTQAMAETTLSVPPPYRPPTQRLLRPCHNLHRHRGSRVWMFSLILAGLPTIRCWARN
ncbi:FHA domain-containing protein [Diaphorobacter aerolatus]|uniref:FHA domain-containing protein n=1 Tax=Diaphorobacter aerolatus TaxID=1288495 RepID=A0A7H0GLD8_9BURK|nr:FHA domain-containing protein [Diaphorobacter aerolatus]QNP49104.1 FHA domain-containing protein [Diaphorobacter aerolatus]